MTTPYNRLPLLLIMLLALSGCDTLLAIADPLIGIAVDIVDNRNPFE